MKKDAETGKTAGVILAAGFGKRMLPLTSTIPKPLLPILGIPLFEITSKKLLRSGASRIHSNIHHLADHFEEFAASRDWPLTLHRETTLLGTGGGIGNMACELADFDTILLHNGDILSSIEYEPAIAYHASHGALITLLLTSPSHPPDSKDQFAGTHAGTQTRVPRRLPPPSIQITPSGEITGIGGARSETGSHTETLGYSGIAVLSREALDYFPQDRRIDLVDILLAMIEKRPGSVMGYNTMSGDEQRFWGEAGSPEFYLDLHRRVLAEKIRFDPLLDPPLLPIHVCHDAAVDPGTRWKGFVEVGPQAVVEKDASLEDCVILGNAVVCSGSSHCRAILYPGGIIQVE
ncbi:MAG: NDP-sugar synthase [Candidatus Krumholzibacteria bacterium]|nr:NDP-sugar synthase [Candidatus Krumholzibacteria bacterium]